MNKSPQLFDCLEAREVKNDRLGHGLAFLLIAEPNRSGELVDDIGCASLVGADLINSTIDQRADDDGCGDDDDICSIHDALLISERSSLSVLGQGVEFSGVGSLRARLGKAREAGSLALSPLFRFEGWVMP